MGAWASRSPHGRPGRLHGRMGVPVASTLGVSPNDSGFVIAAKKGVLAGKCHGSSCGEIISMLLAFVNKLSRTVAEIHKTSHAC